MKDSEGWVLAMCASLILGEGFRGVGTCYASLILGEGFRGVGACYVYQPNPR